jgi:hypothetical protein
MVEFGRILGIKWGKMVGKWVFCGCGWCSVVFLVIQFSVEFCKRNSVPPSTIYPQLINNILTGFPNIVKQIFHKYSTNIP